MGAKQADTYLDDIDRALNSLIDTRTTGTDYADLLRAAQRLIR